MSAPSFGDGTGTSSMSGAGFWANPQVSYVETALRRADPVCYAFGPAAIIQGYSLLVPVASSVVTQNSNKLSMHREIKHLRIRIPCCPL